jgi:Putative transposase
VNLSLLSYVTPDDPDRSELELRLKRKWNDGTESLIFSQRDFVERLAGVVPPPWFNLTRFHGVFAPNHAWRDFVVPGPKTKRTCPAHDEPGGSVPPAPDKPSSGRAPADYWMPWSELLRKTVGVDPEYCVCGARMVIDDAITAPEKISEILERLGIESTGPPKRCRSNGELDYVYDV